MAGKVEVLSVTERLVPTPAASPVASLSLADLWAHYEWPATGTAPYVRANMVASVDGAAFDAAGRSRGLSLPTDREIMRVLRAGCDALLVGAATARSESYPPPPIQGELAELRAGAGRAGGPLLVVVTGSGSVPARIRELARNGRALVAEPTIGRPGVDLTELVAALAARGRTRVLCEGGPTVLAQLVGAGLVNDVCLTISPQLLGPPRSPRCDRIVAGTPWPPPGVPVRLAGLLRDGDMLFARWSLD